MAKVNTVQDISHFDVDPTNANIMVGIDNSYQLIRSANGGKDWTTISTPNLVFDDITFDSQNHTRLYAGVDDKGVA